MNDKMASTNPSYDETALERTRLATVRTEFALMRTGFSIAAFGVAVVQYVGADNWPGWATDALSFLFVLIGMAFVQSGLSRFQASVKTLGSDMHSGAVIGTVLKVAPWLLQAALLALLVLGLIY